MKVYTNSYGKKKKVPNFLFHTIRISTLTQNPYTFNTEWEALTLAGDLPQMYIIFP